MADYEETKTVLEARLEELKDWLYELDRAIIDRVGLTGKPSPEEKKARSAVVKEINKTRREIYKLIKGKGSPKKITLTLTAEEYRRLEQEAVAEGVGVRRWIKRKLFD